MDAAQIAALLREEASPANVAGMARFGIKGAEVHGITMARLRQIARAAGGRDRALAREMWKEGSHEGKILAALLDEPERLTRRDAERYLRGLDNWAVTDAFAGNLFDRAPWAYEAAIAWAAREPEYAKRAAFSLMAALTVHDKRAPDAAFLAFLPVIEREADDPRNFVKKAVSWALRQVGKRSARLRREAMACARRIRARGTPSARWIASDVLRELEKRSEPHERPQSRKRSGPSP